jgi:hypothetical protein
MASADRAAGEFFWRDNVLLSALVSPFVFLVKSQFISLKIFPKSESISILKILSVLIEIQDVLFELSDSVRRRGTGDLFSLRIGLEFVSSLQAQVY